MVQAADRGQADDDAGGGLRKIIHVDMDAFFASVEQRDDASLRGLPVAVGFAGGRGVVAAASYEARAFGVRSAMPSATALRLCPDLVFRPPRFDVYKTVSRQIRAVFAEFTPLIEPLSLDEAYLDVTADLRGIGSATRIAELVRTRIKAETGLTASAGVSYNKFLAKLASDQNKPDGLCVIRPGEGERFVAGLPVKRFHGVGPRSAEKLAALGIHTGADLRAADIALLRANFGAQADYLYRAARGIDLRRVSADRVRKSIGAERTYGKDIASGSGLRDALEAIIALLWRDIDRLGAKGRTLTLKLRYADFTTKTHSRTLPRPLSGVAEVTATARALLDAQLPLPQPVRLMGLTLSGLVDATPEPPAPPAGDQLALF
ncbi:MAG: DNA polymerase IV [Sphingomonadales bacterium]|nr:DNA polymerase IV [Sphingomonadales bacterium]